MTSSAVLGASVHPSAKYVTYVKYVTYALRVSGPVPRTARRWRVCGGALLGDKEGAVSDVHDDDPLVLGTTWLVDQPIQIIGIARH